ncbi:hypothetical protein [Cytobacillus kochii]|uniref:hypothetical protein n=1 Tax=Cytobacillus kochii TaxID=859143 RepID=UPI00402AC2AF
MNINFEDIPKHEVSIRSLKTLEKVMFAQDEYGIKKYNHPLNYTQKYDWLAMFTEEMADALKYIQCEIDRKEEVIQLLNASLRVSNPQDYVEAALNLLTVEGTGK